MTASHSTTAPPFDSSAVKASFDRRTAVNGGPAYMVAGVQGVATPDARTAVVTLKEPNSAFLDYLASPFGPKMESPAGLVKNAGADHAQDFLSKHDLGTGPYELSKAETGREYDLTAYPGYWGGQKSPFTTVRLTVYNDVSALQLALDNGDVAGAVNALPSSNLKRYQSLSSVTNHFLPTLGGAALLTLNPQQGLLPHPTGAGGFPADDRPEEVGQRRDGGGHLRGGHHHVRQGHDPRRGADQQHITYDPTVMAAYAKTLPPPNTEMTLGYATGNENAQKMANIVVAQLQTMGIRASAQAYPTATVFSWPNDPHQGARRVRRRQQRSRRR